MRWSEEKITFVAEASIVSNLADHLRGEPPHKLPGSRHQQILSDIQDKILSGEWPPGHRIPIEHDLSTYYGCSRTTVNKVLTQLAGAKLIERRRKAGSFVIRPHSQSAILEIQDIGAEISALGLAYRFAIDTRRKRHWTTADRDRIELPTQTPLLDLTCCHFGGAHPFCLEQRIINLAAVPEAAVEDFSGLSPSTWLVRRVPWTTAEHRIMASGADPEAAAMLKIETATPCLVVERRTWSAEQPITFVRLTYPGEAHQIVARFMPSLDQ